AWRLRQEGWLTTCAAEAVGVHLGSATFVSRSAPQRRLAGFSRGYLLRRYGVLRSRFAARTLLTEMIVVLGDALRSHDLLALTGRFAGWSAASGKPRLAPPPSAAIDGSISLRESLELRRGIHRAPANL